MKKTPYFIHKNNNIPLSLIRSNRKSITLTINIKGEILIKAPLYITNNQIQKFVDNQTNWIINKINHNKEHYTEYSFIRGSYIPYLGEKFVITDGIDKKEIVLDKKQLLLPINCINIEKDLIKWYRKQAKEIITNLVNYYSSIIGVDYNNICIKAQKTRWGSCSGKNNLNFNWKIILTNMDLVKYLIIHEVCHLKEMNHSSKFWILVEKYDSNFKNNRKELQKYGYYLLSYLE